MFGEILMSVVSIIFVILVIVFVKQSVRVVPQQEAWVVERLGKYSQTLEAGLHFLIPVIDRVAYRHSLKEVALKVDPQSCFTKDNTTLEIDGVVYLQVTDPVKASYGAENYIQAVVQLAQTTLRSVVGRLDLDEAFSNRDSVNAAVVSELDKAALNWGTKLLRYEVSSLELPENIKRSMQAQLTAERDRRALVASSEGRRQEQINLADGEKQAAVARSEGEKIAAINAAQGQAEAITAVAEATAAALERIGAAISKDGGKEAVSLQVAEKYVAAFANLAKEGTAMIIPQNLTDISGAIATAMKVVEGTNKV